MKLTRKDQVIVLDNLELLSKQYELTDEELDLISRIESEDTNHKLARDHIIENNLRNENYILKEIINYLLYDHDVELGVSNGQIGNIWQAKFKGKKSDGSTSKYTSLIQVLKAVYLGKDSQTKDRANG